VRFLSGGGFGFALRWNCAECCEAQRQKLSSAAVGEEAEVADADEALGEQVQQEATQELVERYGHQFLLVVMGRIAPAKGDLVIGQGDESMVGDGDAVGVVA
jgi:hypothetical protein